MFSLDYDTICQIIERMHYTGVIEASIPSGKYAHGKIVLRVQNGDIQLRMLLTTNKQQITDVRHISQQLAKFSFLEWHLLPLTPTYSSAEEVNHAPSLQPVRYSAAEISSGEEPGRNVPSAATLPTLSSTSYPRRLPVDTDRLNTWPFIHRQVYNLSTGQYSEQDIAHCLRSAPADLLKVLKDLERMEVVLRGISRI